MTAKELLVIVIGLFIAVVGLMYFFHLKGSSAAAGKIRLAIAIVSAGLLTILITVVMTLSGSGESERGKKSALMGKDAFGPPPAISTGPHELAAKLYEDAVAMWNTEMNGFDSVQKVHILLDSSITVYETAEAYSARGQCRVQMSMMNEAIKDYNRAIELNAAYANPYFLRAAVYFIMNDMTRACEDWKKAAELGMPAASGLVESKCS